MAGQGRHPPEVGEEYTFDRQADAEQYRDLRETQDEVAYLVVRCRTKYYVVAAGTRDDPRTH
jgi:hypothetical protein